MYLVGNYTQQRMMIYKGVLTARHSRYKSGLVVFNSRHNQCSLNLDKYNIWQPSGAGLYKLLFEPEGTQRFK